MMAEEILQHSTAVNCQREQIADLADTCDNEFYMSAVGPPWGHAGRSERGYKRILETLGEFERRKIEMGCPACQSELSRQFAVQAQTAADIAEVWKRHGYQFAGKETRQ